MPSDNEFLKLKITDLFRKLDPSLLTKNDTAEDFVPDEFFQRLLNYVLERGYLNTISSRDGFNNNSSPYARIPLRWMKIGRLPIHPDELKEYDLFSRWQGVLSTLHTWHQRLYFLLQRKDGQTTLYLGTKSLDLQNINAEQAISQFKEAAANSMPGLELLPLDNDEGLNLIRSLMSNKCIGTVTGIPSFKSKNTHSGSLQTLDQLAFGIRNLNNEEQDYSLLVIAEPMTDADTSDTINRFRKLGSEIHTSVMQTVSEGDVRTMGTNMGGTLNIGMIVGALAMTALSLGGPVTAPLIAMSSMNSVAGQAIPGASGMLGAGAFLQKGVQRSISKSSSVAKQQLDKFAQSAEQTTDMHCKRLQKGRNLGFWNVGVYALSKYRDDLYPVLGILRSIYSGDESYLEPIRTAIIQDGNAVNIVAAGELLPLADPIMKENDALSEWSIFGKAYQYVSTPMNTEELSIATSLPRRDVPGLRFVKTAVRFASNPAECKGDVIGLGSLVDTGVVQTNQYNIDPNSLVRHALVAGSTGSGKSTTTKRIIHEVLNRNTPVLILEPAKDDYVRWALAYNRAIDSDTTLSISEKEMKKFAIYMPGVDRFEGVEMMRLKLNPFQPAGIADAPVDMVTRCEQATALFNASLPASDILPILIDESMYKYVYSFVGDRFLDGDIPPLSDYPKLDGVAKKAREVLAARGYDRKVQDDLGAALDTRFTYLTRGKRGKILNVNSSTNYHDLFEKPVVINLSRIADQKDKSLIMSLLLLSLYEYRVSAYTHDEQYRKNAQKNKLMHLAVIEEAHHVLQKPFYDIGKSGNPQQAVADIFTNILSEIRGYGQGIVIVDQVPTRLINDAIKNTNYKIVHRLTSPDDCEVMAAGLALRSDQKKIIPSLGVGDAIICGDLDDAAAWVRITPVSFKQGDEK